MLRKIPLSVSYRLLSPGPLVAVSSLYNGRAGLTPVAWHMPVNDDPPMIALEIYKGHFIYKAIMQTGDFVVNIPSSAMAVVIRKLGSFSGATVDKFSVCGLTKERSKKVASPRLGGAIAVLECRLRREKALARKYDMILGDVVYAEAEKKLFTDRWRPEQGGTLYMNHLGGPAFTVPARRVI